MKPFQSFKVNFETTLKRCRFETLFSTRFSAAGSSNPAPGSGCSTSAFRSVARRTAEFRDKLIFHQFVDFLLAVAFAAAEQIGHSDLQCTRQPFQGRQRRRGFLVFNFGNVGTGHGHASRELALAEPVAQAQGADGGRQVQVSATVAGHGHHHGWRYQDGFGFRFLVQRRVAASAIIIGCTELDQQAVIASYDFPRVYRGKSRGHRVVGVPERATPCTY